MIISKQQQNQFQFNTSSSQQQYTNPVKVFSIIIFIIILFLLVGLKRKYDPQIHYNQGLQFYHYQNYPKALISLTRSIQLQSSHPSYLPFLYRAKSFQMLKNISQSQQNYNKAIEILNSQIHKQQEKFDGYYQRARFFMRIKKNHEALQDFKLAIKLKPQQYYVYYYLGLLLQYKLNQTKKAIQNFEKCLNITKYYDSAYVELGNIMMKKNKTSDAIKLFSKGIELNPLRTRYYLKRAKAYQKNEDFQSAQEDYKKGTSFGRVNTRFDKGYYFYGKFLMRRQRYKQAIQMFNKGIEVGKDLKDLQVQETCYKYLNIMGKMQIYKILKQFKSVQLAKKEGQKIIKQLKALRNVSQIENEDLIVDQQIEQYQEEL